MATSGFPDLMDVLVNVGKVIPDLIMMLQGVSALVGLCLVASALIGFWAASNDNASKFMASNQRVSVMSSIVTLVIGSLLLGMGTLELVGIASRTITGGFTDNRITAEALSYSGSSSTLSEKAQVATMALLGIMQIVGFIALAKGWYTINQYAKQQTQASLFTAFGYIIGGALAWNFKWFSDVVNNTLGFSVLSLFS